MLIRAKRSDSEILQESLLFVDHDGEACVSRPPRNLTGPRWRRIYAQLVRQAYAQYLVEAERSRRGAQCETYNTTYEDVHGVEGFVPSVEQEVKEQSQPEKLEEPVLTVWLDKQRAGAPHGQDGHSLTRVTPAHQPEQPFRRTSLFTTPVHLSLHEPPQETVRGAVRLARVVQEKPIAWGEWGAPKRAGHFPLADTFSNVGKKYWCDR